ncbi:DNA polymerase III subunit delta' [Thalassotalea sp. Y01]|uniref:DNA polymerase III subunit delta' n=1 Tax=Thalassotalea sp. Y01 TaxID=2729613 RepID=UPI00145CF4D7|nr:DNA polymerase III subunit delta' [Thalassotalea sp. Y01]NMP15556.1 DNA polymerase III subunit delta' [Thalassotalea sp. Y01]
MNETTADIASPWLESNKQDLINKYLQKILPHALLIHGSYGAGQLPLAHWLGNSLLCENIEQTNEPCGQCKTCQLLKAQSHPDFVVIDNDDKTIGVDLVRKACQFLEKTAQLGRNKVVMISHCENMTESAANALLKTLEEPTNNSFLLLVCNDIEQLLPTIISRCSKVAITPPQGEQLAQVAVNKQVVHPFSTIAEIAELTDEDVYNDKRQLLQSLARFIHQFDNGVELIEQIQASVHGIRWLQFGFESMFRYHSGWQQALADNPLSETVDGLDAETVFACLNLTMQANRQLKTLTQANKTYTLEVLLVELEQTIRNAA